MSHWPGIPTPPTTPYSSLVEGADVSPPGLCGTVSVSSGFL